MVYVNMFSQDNLIRRYQFFKLNIDWLQIGCPIYYFYQLNHEAFGIESVKVGSPLFLKLWQIGMKYGNYENNIQMVLNALKFPRELSGEREEIDFLMSSFSLDLPPHHSFWWELAYCIDKIFPQKKLCLDNYFAKRVHQLRYLISCQQAQHIRYFFKKGNETDEQAFLAYLGTLESKDLITFESARFHNKLNRNNPQNPFPLGVEVVNIKVLINFHTEFIIDSYGNFVNELDAECFSLNGVINGASFNYGKAGKRHWELDVYPVEIHDPNFRMLLVEPYISANTLRRKFLNPLDGAYQYSYFNSRGFYSWKGKSMSRLVQEHQNRLIKKLKTQR